MMVVAEWISYTRCICEQFVVVTRVLHRCVWDFAAGPNHRQTEKEGRRVLFSLSRYTSPPTSWWLPIVILVYSAHFLSVCSLSRLFSSDFRSPFSYRRQFVNQLTLHHHHNCWYIANFYRIYNYATYDLIRINSFLASGDAIDIIG
jgi:hypothetical protein